MSTKRPRATWTGDYGGRHEGTVRKPRSAGGGAWSYRVDLGLDSDGRRAQKQVAGFRTKKDAQAALSDALSS